MALSPNNTIVGLVYRSCEPHAVDDATGEPAYEDIGSEVFDAVRSALAVPLVVEGRSAGALLADNFSRSRAFGEDDLRLLQSLAAQAAAAIQNKEILSFCQAVVCVCLYEMPR